LHGRFPLVNLKSQKSNLKSTNQILDMINEDSYQVKLQIKQDLISDCYDGKLNNNIDCDILVSIYNQEVATNSFTHFMAGIMDILVIIFVSAVSLIVIYILFLKNKKGSSKKF
jgi:hypothetical protein